MEYIVYHINGVEEIHLILLIILSRTMLTFIRLTLRISGRVEF